MTGVEAMIVGMVIGLWLAPFWVQFITNYEMIHSNRVEVTQINELLIRHNQEIKRYARRVSWSVAALLSILIALKFYF